MVEVERTVLTLPWGDVDMLAGGQGPPVVVLHRDLGNLGWGELHDLLAGRHRVLAPSLPGFGTSDLPAWARSVAHVAALTGHLLDRLGGPCHLVGLGWGGWVAAEIAALSPGRVAGLVLVSPMGLKPDTGEVVDQFLYAAGDYARLGFADATAFDRVVGSPDDEDVAAALDHSREAVTRVAWKPIGHDRALPGLLACVRVPALVVWGDGDAVVPSSTAAQWGESLHADTIMVPGGGHHVEVDRPGPVADAVLAFLAGRAPALTPSGAGGPTCS